MNVTLEQLIAQLERGQNDYTPLTREELERRAQTRYQTEYDDRRLGAQQTYQQSDAALLRELAGLQAAYDAQRAQSAAGYAQTYREADRHALSRGMQRSSYLGATLAGIGLAGQQAQQDISQQQTQAEGELQDKRTLLGRQLSQTLESLDRGQRSDTLRYLDELEAREYDRLTAHTAEQNRLALQLYEYQHQLEQEAAEQARWQAEFTAKYGGGTGSGGAGKGGSRARRKQSPPAVAGLGAALAALGGLAGVSY